MKHSIRKDDVKYVIQPEQKKVVAYIEGTRNLFNDFVEENAGPWIDQDFWISDSQDFSKKLEMPNKFVGVATCGPDDEWNEDTGRLIAFDRMKDSLNKSFFKRANTYVAAMEKALDDFCDKVNAYGAKLEHNTIRRKQVISKVLGDAEE